MCAGFFVWLGFCLFVLIFKLTPFRFVQDPEVMGFTRAVLAQMVLGGLNETMGNLAFLWGAARRQITLQIYHNAAPGFAESPTETPGKAGRSNCKLFHFHLLVKPVKFFVDILTNNASEMYFPLTSYSFFFFTSIKANNNSARMF